MRKASHPKNLTEFEMLETLASMRNQYCSSTWHMSMSAWEQCSAILEEYWYLPHDDHIDINMNWWEAKTPPRLTKLTDRPVGLQSWAYRIIDKF